MTGWLYYGDVCLVETSTNDTRSLALPERQWARCKRWVCRRQPYIQVRLVRSLPGVTRSWSSRWDVGLIVVLETCRGLDNWQRMKLMRNPPLYDIVIYQLLEPRLIRWIAYIGAGCLPQIYLRAWRKVHAKRSSCRLFLENWKQVVPQTLHSSAPWSTAITNKPPLVRLWKVLGSWDSTCITANPGGLMRTGPGA